MSAVCLPFAQGRRIRLTKLDDCGRPLLSDPCGQVVSKGFVQIPITSVTETGTSIVSTNAAGELCYQVRSKDQFLRNELSITFCEVDPTLFTIAAHTRPVFDFNGDIVGFRELEGQAEHAYALEVWMGVPGQECQPGAETSLGYVLFPWLEPGAIGDWNIQNDAINFQVSGFTRAGGGWGVGPYDVVDSDGMGTPGPLLDAIEDDVHLHVQWTSIAAPDPLCGCEGIPGGAPTITSLEPTGTPLEVQLDWMESELTECSGIDHIVDWGDGDPPETIVTPTVTATHTYAEAGTYTVTLTPDSAGCPSAIEKVTAIA